MASNNGVPIKEYLDGIFKEFKDRHTSEQKAQDDKFEDFRKQLKEEDKLLADKYKSDMAAYPNIDDFNKLQEKVTADASAAVAKARIQIVVITTIIAIAAVVVAWYKP